MHPKVSSRKLADMRKNAEYLGITVESIGLPPKKEKKHPRTKPPKVLNTKGMLMRGKKTYSMKRSKKKR